MKKLFSLIVSLGFFTAALSQNGNESSILWNAKWISTMENQNETNTWLAYRKIISIEQIPEKAFAKIAVDSKYWLWINGEMIVFEGGLKRGPNPFDTYYDEVDIAPFLKKGRNIIALQVWYFGKDGFSHKSSGKAGLLFDCTTIGLQIISDASWQCSVLKAYKTCDEPNPNFRLPESNILFDATKNIGNWQTDTLINLDGAIVLAKAGDYPWNKLIKRPVPLWKNYPVKKMSMPVVHTGSLYDTLIYRLPYNAQFTPVFIINSSAKGKQIKFFTDNYHLYSAGGNGLRGEYITKQGEQLYESLGWINGHQLYIVKPKDVQLIEVAYRETGYDCNFAGSFHCSDTFFNSLWKKSLRTLYVTMRDSYMDCPDRERAQWTGDAVNESGEAFYALDTKSHLLAKKWLHEITDWQLQDSSLYAPVPSGNWTLELPDQILSTIGYYGAWNYFLNTGDTVTLQKVYNAAKKYLTLWKIDDKGLVQIRTGGWAWGDWGDNKDMELIFNLLYYLAVKGMYNAAMVLHQSNDAAYYSAFMQKFKTSFNQLFWNGNVYRHLQYKLKDDDRVQALAVVSGIADKEKYASILKTLQLQKHASPYMEKYVMEAFFMMGYEKEGLARTKERFADMVNDTNFTTLWEGWKYNDEKYGGGTINHAWSGGALTILSQYLCGITPVEPGYKKFQVLPQPGNIKEASATVASVAGIIKSAFIKTDKKFQLTVSVPQNTSAIIGVPVGRQIIKLNGRVVWRNGKIVMDITIIDDGDSRYIKFPCMPGTWVIESY
jgi:alpha-L-rhamnosidase